MGPVRAIAALIVAACATTGDAKAAPYHLIPGRIPMDLSPDGNTVVLDAPQGLIVFDTGRHLDHAQAILDYAERRRRPIAAILNSHWHMDHVQGNFDLRQVYPRADVYATSAIESALTTLLPQGRKTSEARLADPQTSPARVAQIKRFIMRMDDPDSVRPTRPLLKSAKMTIAGRRLDVRVAPFAATEADLWVYDPKEKLAVVGDLVVGVVPFMDTACIDGWARALEAIAATPFRTLIPGHGEAMTRSEFFRWKNAFDSLVACGRSDRTIAECSDQWARDAEAFIAESHREYARETVSHYVESRLRSSAEEQERFCRPAAHKR